jgi:hypothetical protein
MSTKAERKAEEVRRAVLSQTPAGRAQLAREKAAKSGEKPQVVQQSFTASGGKVRNRSFNSFGGKVPAFLQPPSDKLHVGRDTNLRWGNGTVSVACSGSKYCGYKYSVDFCDGNVRAMLLRNPQGDPIPTKKFFVTKKWLESPPKERPTPAQLFDSIYQELREAYSGLRQPPLTEVEELETEVGDTWVRVHLHTGEIRFREWDWTDMWDDM